MIDTSQYWKITTVWNRAPNLNNVLTCDLIFQLNHDGKFSGRDNASHYDIILHHLEVIMSHILRFPDIMGVTLYKILHGLKYQVFPDYGLSNIQYGGDTKTF